VRCVEEGFLFVVEGRVVLADEEEAGGHEEVLVDTLADGYGEG
jgi:hypothetical protein